MKSFFKRQSDFVYNIFTLAKGTAFSQILPIIITPFLTRLFTPEEFGILAVYISIIAILGVISTWRYELAIVLPKSENDAIQLFWLSTFIAFFFSLFIFMCLFFFHKHVTSLFNSYIPEYIIFLIPISIFILGLTQSLMSLFNRYKNYREMSSIKIVKASTTGGLQIVFGTQDKIYSSSIANMGLVSGYVLGQLAGLIAAIKMIMRIFNKLHFHTSTLVPNYRQIKGLAHKYRSLPLLNAPSSILNSASIQLTPVLLSIFYSPAITGFFSLSQRILQIPMMFLGSSISQVYFQKANEIQDEPDLLRKLTKDINKKLLIIGFIPVSIILLIGDHLFAFIFGEEWRIAGIYAQYLSIWIYIVFVSSPLSHLMTVLSKQPQLLAFNSLLFLSRISWIFFATLIFQDPKIIVLGLGIIGSIIWLIFIFYVLNIAGMTIYEIFTQILPFICFVLGLFFIGLYT